MTTQSLILFLLAVVTFPACASNPVSHDCEQIDPDSDTGVSFQGLTYAGTGAMTGPARGRTLTVRLNDARHIAGHWNDAKGTVIVDLMSMPDEDPDYRSIAEGSFIVPADTTLPFTTTVTLTSPDGANTYDAVLEGESIGLLCTEQMECSVSLPNGKLRLSNVADAGERADVTVDKQPRIGHNACSDLPFGAYTR